MYCVDCKAECSLRRGFCSRFYAKSRQLVRSCARKNCRRSDQVHKSTPEKLLDGPGHFFNLCDNWHPVPSIDQPLSHPPDPTYLTANSSTEVISSPAVKMSSPQLNKIAANSPSRQNPSELETSIAGALYDLETGTADLKAALRPLQFVSAKEV